MSVTPLSSAATTVSRSTVNGTSTKDSYNRSRVFRSRVFFLVCLAGVAAALCLATYKLLTDTERRLARVQFEAFAESALDLARKNANRQKQGLVSLASVVEQTLPEANEWPFVHVPGFATIAQNIINTSNTIFGNNGMGLMPIVTPDQVTEFEDYAYNVVKKGNAPFDRMWGMDGTFQKYNETDGSTHWGSPNKIMTPFFQHSLSDMLFLMNWHSIEARGRLVDEMIECSKVRAQEMLAASQKQNDNNNADLEEEEEEEAFVPRECSVSTDIIDLNFKPVVDDPAAVCVQPVYPANDPTKMTGLITSAIRWEDTLLDVFSSEVSGVDCVVKTSTQTFTYAITHGKATLKGEGDSHDRNFDEYAQQVLLSGPGLYSSFTPTYTLVAYPNEALFKVYETNNPIIAAVGALCIILFVSIIFFLYDYFVRSEFEHKEALSQARRQFVRFISHEVRTPLSAVCMGLQLWKDELVKNNPEDSAPDVKKGCLDEREERIRKYAAAMELQEGILSNADSAVGVLNDLLQYDKVESGTLHLEKTSVPIFELVERTAAEFRNSAKLKKIDYALDYAPLLEDQQKVFDAIVSAKELPQEIKNRHVIGDATRLEQVLRNLVSNAIKFSPEGATLRIRMVSEAAATEPTGETMDMTLHSGDRVKCSDGGTLRIEVTDTGAGMTPDQLKMLFKEGVQFDVNKLQAGKGSGLGLYIAKGILEQHGGSLEASSDGIGRGTTFTMSIPLFYIPDTGLPEDEDSQRTVDWDMLDPLNILVVDDAKLNRKLLSRLLRNHGNVCDEAENGRIAVDRVIEVKKKGVRFDAILMDYEMPELDGAEAARELRAMGCDSFIVGITGSLFSEDVENFKRCGANAVLPKPLDLKALCAELVENGVADASILKTCGTTTNGRIKYEEALAA